MNKLTSASNIKNVPTGNISATDVQSALNELDSEKAPSGFGLGTYAKDCSYRDLNDYTVTGFFRGSSLTNAPNASSGWFYITVIGHLDGVFAQQEAIEFYIDGTVNGQKGCRYTRNKVNGSWSAWKQIAITDSPTFSGNTVINIFNTSNALSFRSNIPDGSNLGIRIKDGTIDGLQFNAYSGFEFKTLNGALTPLTITSDGNMLLKGISYYDWRTAGTSSTPVVEQIIGYGHSNQGIGIYAVNEFSSNYRFGLQFKTFNAAGTLCTPLTLQDDKVLIGTTSQVQSSKLSVTGNIGAEGQILSYMYSKGFKNVSGSVIALFGAVSSSSDYVYLGSETNHALSLCTNNTERMNIAINGLVTCNISEYGQAMQIKSSNLGVSGFMFRLNNVSDVLSTGANYRHLLAFGGSESLAIRTNNRTTNDITIDNGLVAIGHNSPKANLHSTGTTILGILSDTTNISFATMGNGQCYITNSGGGNTLDFWVKKADGTTWKTSLTLSSAS